MKEFADDNFKFDGNGRKLSKQVENTVGKGEIACYEQFLLFPQCFQKTCFPEASKGVIVWEWVKFRNMKNIFTIIFQNVFSSVYFQYVNERAAHVKIDLHYVSSQCRPQP